MAKGAGQFWVAELEKAVDQIYKALENKKRKVYVTRRWVLIAWLMKQMPYTVFKKIG